MDHKKEITITGPWAWLIAVPVIMVFGVYVLTTMVFVLLGIAIACVIGGIALGVSTLYDLHYDRRLRRQVKKRLDRNPPRG